MSDNNENNNNETETPSMGDCLARLADAQEMQACADRDILEVLHLIVDNHGKSFTMPNGTLHQIRTRKGNPYLVTLKEEPKVYLARARKVAAHKLMLELQASGDLPVVATAPVTPVEAEVTMSADPEDGLDLVDAAEAADSEEAEVVLQ